MARPTKYNEERAEEILNLYSEGMNLQQVEKKKNLPSRRTICRWRKAYPEFGKAYDIALEAHSEAIVEECLYIADNEEDAKKAKNRIDIRTWIATKHNRPKYGESFQLDIKQFVDISPALVLAVQRMHSLGSGALPEPLKEADIA